MRRLIALEWNEEEARLVVASGRKGIVRFEQAFAVPLTDAQSTGAADSPAVLDAKTIGQKIARAASERGVGQGEVLVALGRSSIELRQLTLPPAPDEELPNLVRFQAVREFNALEDDWLLDFVLIDEAADWSGRFRRSVRRPAGSWGGWCFGRVRRPRWWPAGVPAVPCRPG